MTSQNIGMRRGPDSALDQKAALAQADDEASIRSLADAVASIPHVYGRMPSVVEAFVEERLVKAEIAYEKGTMRGVEEESVIRFVNSLMDHMGHQVTQEQVCLRFAFCA